MWRDIENRMVVEGARYQRELYARRDDADDHIIFVRPDGDPVYEEFYGPDDRGEVVYLCDIYQCSECPRYGDDCDGEEMDDDI